MRWLVILIAIVAQATSPWSAMVSASIAVASLPCDCCTDAGDDCGCEIDCPCMSDEPSTPTSSNPTPPTRDERRHTPLVIVQRHEIEPMLPPEAPMSVTPRLAMPPEHAPPNEVVRSKVCVRTT